MRKMIISVLLAMMIFVSSAVCVSAQAPSSFKADTKGTVSNLITVKKPDSSSTTTMKTTYSVTGVGKTGVNVCFYTYDGEKYVPITGEDSATVAITIGASGVFYRQIALREGSNRLCVRAESADGNVQYVYLSINVIKNEALANIGSFSFDMQSKYNGWLN